MYEGPSLTIVSSRPSLKGTDSQAGWPKESLKLGNVGVPADTERNLT